MELPDPIRQRLGNFSRAVFTDSNRTVPEYSEGPENEMLSSLPLQMSLYFNTYYFPLWWVSSIMMLHVKYSILPDYYKFIAITVIILITLIEAIRLYLGYMGNLQEKHISELTVPSGEGYLLGTQAVTRALTPCRGNPMEDELVLALGTVLMAIKPLDVNDNVSRPSQMTQLYQMFGRRLNRFLWQLP
ncbi:hypothetical protein H8959_013640 [Pygathrix nigripes]